MMTTLIPVIVGGLRLLFPGQAPWSFVGAWRSGGRLFRLGQSGDGLAEGVIDGAGTMWADGPLPRLIRLSRFLPVAAKSGS
jgi:hypothetical protein